MTESRVYQLKPDSPWTYVLGAVLFIVAASLAVLFFTFALVALAVGVVVVPIIGWWRRRKLAKRGPGPQSGATVIDVEYEIK